jgi:peptidyl-prolyl cis-trans isomerase B (cyclophilin B)
MPKKRTSFWIYLAIPVILIVIGFFFWYQGHGAEVITQNPVATITMENGAQIKIELYPNVAPNTVRNFIALANSKFYDGTIFHRVIPNFMIQGGDPEGTGAGGPGYSINGEFTANGFVNTLKHERGVISMARTNDPDSAGSQFFIMVATTPSLDGKYAAFGKVISGMDEVDRIVAVERDKNDKPYKVQRMATVRVETFGSIVQFFLENMHFYSYRSMIFHS